MAADPKAKLMTVAYEGGTLTATTGLIEELFGAQNLKWRSGSILEGITGKRRYKYRSRQLNNAAAGTLCFFDLGAEGIFTGRVTGAIVDFLDAMLPKTGDKVKGFWTQRGTAVGPTPEDLN